MKVSDRWMFRALFVTLASLCGLSAQAGPSKLNSSFPKPALDNPVAPAHSQETAVLAGGCFWGAQAVFQHTRGVISATSGYAGGDAETAHYEKVSEGNTGHAESVKVVFDPSQITYGQILMVFFAVAHNPTELNKQGPDWGTQYRSALFYASAEQQKIAEAYITQLNSAKIYSQEIVTEVVPLQGFYPAEKVHQNFVELHPDNPYIVINDLPKLANLRKQFPELYRDN